MRKLVCIEGPDKGYSCEVHDEGLIIGSAAGIGCALHDPAVSPRHALISVESGTVELSRTASGGEIYLNGARSWGAVLKDGDLLKLGNTVFRFEQSAESVPGPSAVVFSRKVSEAADELPLPDASMKQGEREELERRHAALGKARALAGKVRGLEELSSAILELAVDRLPSSRSCAAFENASGEFEPSFSRSSVQGEQTQLTPSRAITHAALRQQMVVVTLDASADARFKESQSVMIQRLSSAVCAPIIVRGVPRGFLYVEREKDTFSAQDAAFCAALAVQAAELVSAMDEHPWKDSRPARAQVQPVSDVSLRWWFFAVAAAVLALLMLL